MTTSPDSVVGEAFAAPVASGLLMVGASGAVCVDGACVVDPAADTTQTSDPETR